VACCVISVQKGTSFLKNFSLTLESGPRPRKKLYPSCWVSAEVCVPAGGGRVGTGRGWPKLEKKRNMCGR
jgi:hypothetical protein